MKSWLAPTPQRRKMNDPDLPAARDYTLVSRLYSLADVLESRGFRIEASLVAAAGLSLRQQERLRTAARRERESPRSFKKT